MEPYVVFALFILAIGLAGSVVIGIPSVLLLRTELKQYSDSRRFALTACCGLSGVATLLLTALWSLSLTLDLAHLSTGPSADELIAWIKAFIGFGLSPGLSLFSAGLTSLCWRRS
jgi:hypothetical protein